LSLLCCAALRECGFGLDDNKPYPDVCWMLHVCCDHSVTDEVRQLGELAVRLAVEAGEIARRGRRAGFAVDTKSSATDVVTEVDRRVERWLGEAIRSARPTDSVLGEEGGAHHGTSRVRWILDPIDGTVNFTLGLAQYAVSIGVELDGQLVAACVHNPETGDVYRARTGDGAYLRSADGSERRLRGPRDVPVTRMVVGTGFSYDAHRRRAQAEVLPHLLPRIGDIRRFGAASLDLCAVAAGTLDGYFEFGLNLWDYAAGLLIAHEAGCVSSGLRGRLADTRFTAVCGPSVATEFFGLLTEVGADLAS
jgi:myo-inositol-1(or 4)-monophosphatase